MAKRRSQLSKSTDRRLKTYAMVAIAAGVGAMALAQPAEGEVVITRKKIPIPVSSYFDPPPHPVFLSLNNNGINDFSFSLSSFAYHGRDMILAVRPLEGGAVQGHEMPGVNGFSAFYDSMLKREAKIGPSAHFSSAQGPAVVERQTNFVNSTSYSITKSYGNWGGNASNTYLGVKFLIDGETHYGWGRLMVATSPTHGISATITAYAYESEANKKIIAGVPEGGSAAVLDPTTGPSLGALAAGAEGLPRWKNPPPVEQNSK